MNTFSRIPQSGQRSVLALPSPILRARAHRQKVADILEIDVAHIPDQPSWAYDQIMDGILRDRIKGLWVIATNTAHSWINQADAHTILNWLDFLVAQDMYTTTETTAFADLV